MTVKEKAQVLGIQPSSLRKRFLRKGFTLGVNDPIPAEAMEAIDGAQPQKSDVLLQTPAEALFEKARNGGQQYDIQLSRKSERIRSLEFQLESEDKENEKLSEELTRYKDLNSEKVVMLEKEIRTSAELREQLQTAKDILNEEKPLPWHMILINGLPNAMIGLAASFGVFHYSSHFMPQAFAYIEAAAFEFVYIRLTSMNDLPEKIKRLARKVSLGAVAVSVIYNTISARMYTNPEWINELSSGTMWMLNILHGLPLALIGYFLVEVIFHEKR